MPRSSPRIAAAQALANAKKAVKATAAANLAPKTGAKRKTPSASAAPASKKPRLAAPGGTTTVKGKKKLDCGEVGSYGDMLKKTGNNKFDRDHVPSKAALQKAAMDLIDDLGITLKPGQTAALFGDKGLISKAGTTVIIPKPDHAAHSDTYGARNTPAKISQDAADLQKAAKKDTAAIRTARGKVMDPECMDKYDEVAEEINKKTHDEYLDEMEKLIRETMKKIKT